MRPAHDLRSAFAVARAFTTAGEGEGEGTSPPGLPSSSPADPDDTTDDTDVDDAEDTEDDEFETVRDKRARKAARDAARYRTAAKAEKERADAAEARVQTLLSRRMEDRFYVAAAGKVTDIEAAWKLADKNTIVINDDGTVVGADEAVTAVIDRYPALVLGPADDHDESGDFVPDAFSPNYTTGGLPNSGQPIGKRPDANRTNDALLMKKYPALATKKGRS